MKITLTKDIEIEREEIKVCSNKTGKTYIAKKQDINFLQSNISEFAMIINNDKEILDKIKDEMFKPLNNLLTCLQIMEIK
jgi:hypothetical protein